MTDQDLVSAVFRKEVLALSAYKVMNAAGMVKLDAMENPYSWSDDIKIRWLEILKDCSLNRYPDPEAGRLVKAIRTLYRLPDTFGLLLGNGSDEIIQLLLMALPSGACVLSPEPGFVMYSQISRCLGLNYVGVPLRADNFDLDLPAMLSAIEKFRPSVIFLAYPNNPTGNLFNQNSILEIIDKATGLVVIDEAYEPFAGTSYLSALGQHDKLLVMRTVSKLGLAGLRLGYIVGRPAIIEQINKIRLPYNINILTQASAEFALSHQILFEDQIRKICSERTVLFNRLNRLKNILAYPSAANFILFKTGENQADGIFNDLQEQGILIKNLNPQGGLLRDCLRVTIGKPEENAAFLTALEKSLASQ